MQLYREALADRPALFTSRLMLRTPDEQDLPAIIEIAGDWEVASRLARMPHPYSESDARFFLDTIVPAELVWVIVERVSQQVVGAIGLALSEDGEGKVALGYYIARSHWGRGIATEAGSVIVAYGVGKFGREGLTSRFYADNPASGRVLQKLGFIEIGASEEPCLATGSTKPSVEMRLSSKTPRADGNSPVTTGGMRTYLAGS